MCVIKIMLPDYLYKQSSESIEPHFLLHTFAQKLKDNLGACSDCFQTRDRRAIPGKTGGCDDVDHQCTHAQHRTKYGTLTLQNMYETVHGNSATRRSKAPLSRSVDSNFMCLTGKSMSHQRLHSCAQHYGSC